MQLILFHFFCISPGHPRSFILFAKLHPMLGLETRHNITLLFSHLKHSRITLIPDLSSIIFLGANDLGIGKALRKEIIELLFKWVCSRSTVFEDNRTCIQGSCLCYRLCPTSPSVSPVKWGRACLRGRSTGRAEGCGANVCGGPWGCPCKLRHQDTLV